MRTLIAAFAVTLLSVAAYAQSNPSLTTSRGERVGHQSHSHIKSRYQKDAENEIYKRHHKSYEDALRSIPDARKETDPWKDAR
jgi:hypothetical protein